MKNSARLFSILFLGLLLSTTPARAEDGFFDSLSKAFKSVSDNVRDQLHRILNSAAGDSPTTDSATTPTPTPVIPTPVGPPPPPVPTGPQLSDCRKYLGYTHDPSQFSDPRKVATVYLNGVLDFQDRMGVDFDAKISTDEVLERNTCAKMALDAGADPNSNAEYNDPDGFAKDFPGPLVRAVTNNDEPAVQLLLSRQANPNVADGGMGRPIPLLKSAFFHASQDIIIELITAGADVTIPDLLWVASSNAADQVVDILIAGKKIPVNQITRFTDYADDQGQTALDVSEANVNALSGYLKKIPAGTQPSFQDKVFEANRILYYHYPFLPQLKLKPASSEPVADPDSVIAQLLQRQQHVSSSLKAAGWTCKEDNCGVVVVDAAPAESPEVSP